MIASWLTCAFIWGQESSGNPAQALEHSGWFSRVQKNIERMEYNVTWQDQCQIPDGKPGYHMANRAQNLRIYFYEEGLTIARRTDSKRSCNFLFNFSNHEQKESYAAASPVKLTINENTILYDYGELTVQYENTPEGIKQFINILSRPKGSESLALVAVLSDKNQEKIVQYKVLESLDAKDRKINTSVDYLNDEWRITISDKDAAYPLTIEGIIKGNKIQGLSDAPSWSKEGTQDEDSYGESVSTAGDVNGDGFSDVIVGAPNYDNGELNEGMVFGYYGSAAGLSMIANWSAEGNSNSCLFGQCICTAGDVNGDGYSDIIIGALYYDNDIIYHYGRAYVYHGSESGLSLTYNWMVQGDRSIGSFASSISAAGDVNGDGCSDVIVGAPSYGNGEIYEGLAFVYHGSSEGLSLTPNWMGESDLGGAAFGSSVSLAGDVNGDGYGDVIVGVHSYSNGESAEGAAFVYHGSSSGLSLTPDWIAEGNGDQFHMGNSVSTAGDVNGDGFSDILVGTQSFNNNSGTLNEGAVFVWHGSPTGLGDPGTPANADWFAEGNASDMWLGKPVNTAGDVNGDGYSDIIVGATGFENSEDHEGAVFIWYGSFQGLGATGNTGNADWMKEGDQEDLYFPSSAATAGDVNGDGYADIIIGAPLYDNGPNEPGKVFVYYGNPQTLNTNFGWYTEGAQEAALLGTSLGTAGDVNGDGYADVIVGAYMYDNGELNEGIAGIFLGSNTGLKLTPYRIFELNQPSAHFGFSVGTAGDVNGDGYSDIIIGAPLYNNTEDNEGIAVLYMGSVTGTSHIPILVGEGDQVGAQFGISVGTAGDVNGDGYSDVIVGAPYYDEPDDEEGKAFVYHGSKEGLSLVANWDKGGDKESAWFGYSVGTAGDVNGDGFSDVIVGAPNYTTSAAAAGKAFVYHGSASGLNTDSNWSEQANIGNSWFGWSVGTAGDINGDGYSDVIIGVPKLDAVDTDRGAVHIAEGSSSGLVPPGLTIHGDSAGDEFGCSVGTAGDVNGDGFADVVIGAWLYTNGQANEGKVYCIHGRNPFSGGAYDWTIEGNLANVGLGVCIASAGDVNGDGYADVIAGAPGFSNGETGEGGAFLFYGNGGRGASLTPRQMQMSGDTPISLLGRSNHWRDFQINVSGKTPFGRGKAQLEWEVKPLGTLFDGNDIQHSMEWVETGTLSSDITGITAVPENQVPCHWRARLHYHPACVPFQQRSRWITIPWNGWQEGDLRVSKMVDSFILY